MGKKAIGVLGGMGPESTALFYQKIIKQYQKQYGAKNDEDYPEIFIYSLPIPDIVKGVKEPAKTAQMLIKVVKTLESVGSQLHHHSVQQRTLFFQ